MTDMKISMLSLLIVSLGLVPNLKLLYWRFFGLCESLHAAAKLPCRKVFAKWCSLQWLFLWILALWFDLSLAIIRDVVLGKEAYHCSCWIWEWWDAAFEGQGQVSVQPPQTVDSIQQLLNALPLHGYQCPSHSATCLTHKLWNSVRDTAWVAMEHGEQF